MNKSNRFSLLLVDDEPWALSGMEEIIPWEEYGFEIVGKCSTASEALRLLGEKKPQAVFTDIRLPDYSGLELIRRIRESMVRTEIVVVSAYSDFEVARQSLEYDVICYLLKPLEEEEVRRAARKIARKLEQEPQACPVIAEKEGKPLFSAEQLAFFEGVTEGGACCAVLFSGEGPRDWAKKGAIVFEALIGGKHAFFLTDRPSAETFPENLFWGMSRPHRNFSDPCAVYHEALLSFLMGIQFCTHPLISEVQLFLAEHISEPISVQRMAGEFYLSPLYLSNLFKKQTGETLIVSLNRTRIRYAKYLLLTTDAPLQEISQAVGFQDYSYFGRMFKKITKESPEHFRKSHEQHE